MLITFLFLNENICCGYSLEVPQRGASNEYPQHRYSLRNKKNIMWIPPLICSHDNPTYWDRQAGENLDSDQMSQNVASDHAILSISLQTPQYGFVQT